MPALRRRLAACAVVGLLVLTACTGGDDDGGDAGATSTAPAAETGTSETGAVGGEADDPPEALASTFDTEPCWWEVPDTVPSEVEVTCGTVEVPSDHSDPDSSPVVLAVVRIHRPEADPDADPILYLHGGPGGDAVVGPPAGAMRLDALAERDVIMFDQRGSGRSTPDLNCPEKEEAVLEALAAPAPWADELEANRAAVRACYDRLVGEGIDLDQYDTFASVADVEVLRETFSVEAWHLWGISYGTRLGLAYADAHPDRVRSLLIDSVYPPEAGGVDRAVATPGDALGRLVDECAEDVACPALGDLGELLDEAVASLDAEPEVLVRTVTVGGAEVERDFAITGADLRGGMFAALYDSTLIPLLPDIIAGLAQGDRAIIPAYIDQGIPRLLDLSEGAYYSIDCADSGRLVAGPDAEAALADAEADGLVALGSAQSFCADWPVEPLPESFNEQVTVDVPTLVFGGTLDPITPHADSEGQADAMPAARFVSVPRGGHGVGGNDDCTREARTTFWADPAADLPSCVAEIAAPPFAVDGP